MQTVIVALIIAGALVYVVAKAFRIAAAPPANKSKCTGCAGCALKNQC